MPVTIPDGSWVDDVVDAYDLRRALGALILPAAPAAARPGRLPGPGTPLAVGPTAPASRSVLIKAGKAITYRSSSYGPVIGVGPDGDVTLDLGAAPATGTQWKRVYLVQRDVKAPANDGAAGAVIDYVAGAVGSQTKPALPAGALLLGEVLDAAGAVTITSSMVTDLPVWTNTRGGLVRVKDQADRDSLLAYPGLIAYREDTGTLELVNLSLAWVTMFDPTPRAATGRVPFTVTGQVASGSALFPQASLPAWPIASRVTLLAAGKGGFASTARVLRWTFDSLPAAGTGAVVAQDDDLGAINVQAPASAWTTVSTTASIDCPANVAPTFRVLVTADGTVYNRGAVLWTRTPA